MLILTVKIKTPDSRYIDIQGIKEDFAMYCERFGDVGLVDVVSDTPEPEQFDMDAWEKKRDGYRREALGRNAQKNS